MRIYGSNGASGAPSQIGGRRTGGRAFTLPETASSHEARATTAPRAAGGIDALLAMQGIGDDLVERRKRSVTRGRNALDALDDLKIGLLSGSLDHATVARLKMAASDLKAISGDPGLDAVISEIELRVEVELAKAAWV